MCPWISISMDVHTRAEDFQILNAFQCRFGVGMRSRHTDTKILDGDPYRHICLFLCAEGLSSIIHTARGVKM